MEGGVLSFVVLLILIAYVAIPVVGGVTTTAWDASSKAIWAIIVLALALVALVAAFRMTGSA